jgi:hypothetical protein
MQAALDQTGELAIAGETHYFDQLRVRLGELSRTPLASEALRAEIEDYFLALTHRPMGHKGDPNKGWMTRTELRIEARSRGDTPDAYFAAFCALWARRRGVERWGEKTPRHVFRLDEILSVFPDSKVLVMQRDPRAVVASYRDWKHQGGFDFEQDPGHRLAVEQDVRRARRSYHPVTITLLWIATMRAARTALRAYGAERVRIESYEGLCSSASDQLERIAEWAELHKPIDPDGVPIRNSSYESFQLQGGFMTHAVDRWQSTLDRADVDVIEFLAWSEIRACGYRTVNARRGLSIAAAMRLATAAPALVRALRANSHRSGRLIPYLFRRARLLLSR